jgi:hypothetical protein
MTLIFTTVGSIADYGGFGRYVLLFFTVVCWAAQYSSMVLTSERHPSMSNVFRELCHSTFTLGRRPGTLHDQLHLLRRNPRLLRGGVPSARA